MTRKEWPPLGLCAKVPGEEDITFPLLRSFINVDVADTDAFISLRQYFDNPSLEKKSHEQIFFKFPLLGATIFHFKATMLTKEKKEIGSIVAKARGTTESGVKRVTRSGLGGTESDIIYTNTPEVFVVNLGPISIDCSKVRVELGFSLKLDYDAEDYEYSLTIPGVMTGSKNQFSTRGFGIERYFEEEVDTRFEARVTLTRKIESVSSPSHKVHSLFDLDGCSNKVFVTFDEDVQALEEDLVLFIVAEEEPRSSLLYQEIDRIDRTNFHVEFSDTVLAKMTFRCSYDAMLVKKHHIFVVDRSGSMECYDRIEESRRALKRCLASLPAICSFEICSFGSSHHFLFGGEGRDLNSPSLSIAHSHVDGMIADMGGTNLLSPLEDIFNRIGDVPSVLFLLTDGEVEDREEVIELIRKHCGRTNTTVSTVGLGENVDTELVIQVASAGRGKCILVENSNNTNRAMQELMTEATDPVEATLPKIEFGDLEKLGAIGNHIWRVENSLPATIFPNTNVEVFIPMQTNMLTDLKLKAESDDFVVNPSLYASKSVNGVLMTKLLAVIELKVELVETRANLAIPALKQEIARHHEKTTVSSREKEGITALAEGANMVAEGITKFKLSRTVQDKEESETLTQQPAMKQEAYTLQPPEPLHKISMEVIEEDEHPIPEILQEEIYRNPPLRAFKVNTRNIGKKKKRRVGPQVMSMRQRHATFDFTRKNNIIDTLAEFTTPNGSFVMAPWLQQLVGKDHFDGDEELEGFATALVVAYLELRLGDRRHEWKNIHAKASIWLKTKVRKSQEVLALARSHLQ